MSITKVIDKIQKLLSLSIGKGTTPAEAASAAAAAQKLMQQYRIEQSQLDVVEEEEKIEYKQKEPLFEGSSLPSWLVQLASGIACANNAKILVRKGSHYYKGEACIMLVGRKSDLQVVEYLFRYTKYEIERLCKEHIKAGHGKGKGYSNSFKIGAASAIGDKLYETHEEERNYYQSAGNTTALVKIDSHQTELTKFVEKISNGKKHRSGGVSNWSGRSDGYKAGSNISVSKGIDAGSSTKLLSY